MGSHTMPPPTYLEKVKSKWMRHKNLNIAAATVLILIVLFTLLAAVQAQNANAWKAHHNCDGRGHFSKTRYLGDSRHEPLRMAEINMKAHACYSKKGWLKKAGAKIYIHSNSTAASLGYRYELIPGHNYTRIHRHNHHIVAVEFGRAATYRQCIPGLPSSPATCGPSGDFHVEFTVFAPHAVRTDPYVHNRFLWLHFEDSWYSENFMKWYVKRNW